MFIKIQDFSFLRVENSPKKNFYSPYLNSTILFKKIKNIKSSIQILFKQILIKFLI